MQKNTHHTFISADEVLELLNISSKVYLSRYLKKQGIKVKKGKKRPYDKDIILALAKQRQEQNHHKSKQSRDLQIIAPSLDELKQQRASQKRARSFYAQATNFNPNQTINFNPNQATNFNANQAHHFNPNQTTNFSPNPAQSFHACTPRALNAQNTQNPNAQSHKPNQAQENPAHNTAQTPAQNPNSNNLNPEQEPVLSNAEQDYINHIIARLEDLELYDSLDEAMIRTYARTLALSNHLFENLSRAGTSLQDSDGKAYANPDMLSFASLSRNLNIFARSLGIGAGNRSHLKPKEKENKSAFEKFLEE